MIYVIDSKFSAAINKFTPQEKAWYELGASGCISRGDHKGITFWYELMGGGNNRYNLTPWFTLGDKIGWDDISYDNNDPNNIIETIQSFKVNRSTGCGLLELCCVTKRDKAFYDYLYGRMTTKQKDEQAPSTNRKQKRKRKKKFDKKERRLQQQLQNRRMRF